MGGINRPLQEPGTLLPVTTAESKRGGGGGKMGKKQGGFSRTMSLEQNRMSFNR